MQLVANSWLILNSTKYNETKCHRTVFKKLIISYFYLDDNFY